MENDFIEHIYTYAYQHFNADLNGNDTQQLFVSADHSYCATEGILFTAKDFA
jgi:hypothetical protein